MRHPPRHRGQCRNITRDLSPLMGRLAKPNGRRTRSPCGTPPNRRRPTSRATMSARRRASRSSCGSKGSSRFSPRGTSIRPSSTSATGRCLVTTRRLLSCHRSRWRRPWSSDTSTLPPQRTASYIVPRSRRGWRSSTRPMARCCTGSRPAAGRRCCSWCLPILIITGVRIRKT